MRTSGIPELRPFLNPTGPVGQIAAFAIGPECFPVRAILFNKSVDNNWSLAWHQDRTIAVKQRIDVDGFGPWRIKSGMVHVEPPFDLSAGIITPARPSRHRARYQCALLTAPGSHKLGRISTPEIPAIGQCERRLSGAVLN